MESSSQKPQKELSRRKTVLRKLEKDREKAFPGLGASTYQAFLEGKIDEESLVPICDNIKEIDSRIEQERQAIEGLKAEIEQLRASKKKGGSVCPYCSAPLEPDARFCPNCGQSIAPAGDTCPSCGVILSPGARFCGSCGHQMASDSPVPPSPPAPAPVAPPPPPAAEVQPPPAPNAPPPPPAAPQAAQPVASTAGGTGEVTTENQERRCPSCSALIEEKDALFCGECGSRLA